MKIVLAICTYRRPRGLARLLAALAALRLADGRVPELDIVVIDSDVGGDGEGLAVCAALSEDYPYPVHASLAPARGISSARNRACAAALALEPTLVAFLDDDEWPSPAWLAELLRVQSLHDADAVGGPTRAVFPEGTDPAVAANPYYGADMRLPDGARCTLEAGGNFLIRASTLARLAPEFFHDAFGRSGNEDLAFFLRLDQLGADMRWAGDALVFEEVPPARLETAWIRHRVLNVANGNVRAMQMLEPGLRPALVRGTKTLALIAAAGLAGLGGLASPTLAARARLMRWRARGKLLAHFGRATERRESY